MSPKPVCIVGPTASGKSAVALAVARERTGVELVSVDSMQVYREMDIGTAKPSAVEQAEVRHHLIDLVEPSAHYTVARFQRDWYEVRDDLGRRGVNPILVGGTGLYFRAVIDDLEIPPQFPEVVDELRASGASVDAFYGQLCSLDPLAASRIDPSNERRIVRALEVTIGSGRPFSSFGPGLTQYHDVDIALIGLRVDGDVLDRRINQRYDAQMAQGFLDEVAALAARPDPLSSTARQALGYRELLRHVEQGEPLDAVLEDAKVRTRRFARRQRKWFGRDPRIRWVDVPAGVGNTLDHRPAIDAVLEAVSGS